MLPVEEIARCSRDEELRPIIRWKGRTTRERNFDTKNLTAVRVGSGIGLFQSEQLYTEVRTVRATIDRRPGPCVSPGNFHPRG
jgi:hypothetical protein